MAEEAKGGQLGGGEVVYYPVEAGCAPSLYISSCSGLSDGPSLSLSPQGTFWCVQHCRLDEIFATYLAK